MCDRLFIRSEGLRRQGNDAERNKEHNGEDIKITTIVNRNKGIVSLVREQLRQNPRQWSDKESQRIHEPHRTNLNRRRAQRRRPPGMEIVLVRLVSNPNFDISLSPLFLLCTVVLARHHGGGYYRGRTKDYVQRMQLRKNKAHSTSQRRGEKRPV